eukprot:CAMPEP_0114277044 /NCGR_PEP_ID=MMETSP0059-20121206/570_1 /TAXON_ID=36894 /ORGANISM="Pyramimonas parkeae, Strain CCMP726" /LENGTH=332 /DNA_ID=CAMNT_0001397103 /DNA_START=72 /DNA_END=1072 /DNA_ORIENTATION=+
MSQWSFESMFNSVLETGRDVTHSIGADGVGLADHELYVEDDETLSYMLSVKARRQGTAELACAAATLRACACNNLNAQTRMHECTDAAKKCLIPPPSSFSFIPTMDMSNLLKYDSDETKPISISELYGELAKEIEAMYKAQLRPIKEDYKKWKLEYLHNQKQLQDRRYRDSLEDGKTLQYEHGMKQATSLGSNSAKEIEAMYKAQLRPIKEDYKKWKLEYLHNQKQLQDRRYRDSLEDGKTLQYEHGMKQATSLGSNSAYLQRTEKMVLKSMQTSAIISAYFGLNSCMHALTTAKLCEVPVGDMAMLERIDAARMDLASFAQKLNLELQLAE